MAKGEGGGGRGGGGSSDYSKGTGVGGQVLSNAQMSGGNVTFTYSRNVNGVSVNVADTISPNPGYGKPGGLVITSPWGREQYTNDMKYDITKDEAKYITKRIKKESIPIVKKISKLPFGTDERRTLISDFRRINKDIAAGAQRLANK